MNLGFKRPVHEGYTHAVPRGLGHRPPRPPPCPGQPCPQAGGSGLDAEGGARALRAAAASLCHVGPGLGGPGGTGRPPHLLPLPHCGHERFQPARGQVMVGMFAYRLVSGHWRVQTGVARTGEEGTVTTARVLRLNVIMGWQHAAEAGVGGRGMHGLPCASMWGGSRRGGGLTSLTSRGRRRPPPPPQPGSGKPSPPPPHARGHRCPPPPPRSPRVRPPGRSRWSRRHGGGKGGRWMSGWSSSIGCSRRGRGRCAR